MGGSALRAAVVTPLSGPLAAYGRAGAAALRLWARQEAEPVELAPFDAHPDPAGAVAAARRFEPDLLFGPYGSGPTAAVARATGRLVWNHGGARTGRRANVVSVLAPATGYFAGPLQVVSRADPGLRWVTVVHGDSGFGRTVADGAVAEAARLGLRVRRAVLPAEPPAGELLLVAGGFADELAVARTVTLGRWRAAGFVGAGVDEVLAELGAHREGLLGPAQWLPEAAPRPDLGPAAAEFVAAYRALTGGVPPYPAAQAFAAGLVAGECVRQAGTTDDDAVLAAARALDRTTMFGRFRLDPETGGQLGHRVLTVQWQDGVRRVVWPPENATAALRYPLPGAHEGLRPAPAR